MSPVDVSAAYGTGLRLPSLRIGKSIANAQDHKNQYAKKQYPSQHVGKSEIAKIVEGEISENFHNMAEDGGNDLENFI